VETLSANLNQESPGGQRMKILVLSTDQTLSDSLANDLSYAIERVDNDEAAATYLDQHNDVIALVIDANLVETPLETWLTRLRTKLAWAGLPALFVIRVQDVELKTLLVQFDAPYVETNEAEPQNLQNALTLLLQGKR
jgi:DNA-binding response OmpR family regulator